MSIKQEIQKLRQEARELRKKIATRTNAWKSQKTAREKLEKENKELKKINKQLEKEKTALEKKLKSINEYNNKLKGQIFKSSVKKIYSDKSAPKRKRGAQLGHKGHKREIPEEVDEEKDVHLTNCPDCNTKLKQSKTTYRRIVEDIPHLPKVKITKYNIQRQWCPKCKKEVCGVPTGTLEYSTIGITTIVWILYQRYRQKVPLNKIEEALREQFGMKITQGGIQYILHKLKRQLKGEYEKILKIVKGSRKKHADESSWRIQGKNGWVWLFGNEQAIYYTIEETRGKGVPQEVIGDDPESILVRDDYAAYKNLNIIQQSCWSHLLGESDKKLKLDKVPKEMLELHEELKVMFLELKEYEGYGEKTRKERDEAYVYYLKKIEEIVERKYESDEAKAIQTRIGNQKGNLITAVKYEGIPLTNNFAERGIRQFASMRNVSGGSQSVEGAKTIAVLMSVMQTLTMNSKSLFQDLTQMVNANRFCLETSE